MIYLLGWGLLFFSLFIQEISRYKGKFFIFIGLIFFAGIAFLRGDVGTDTSNYELMLRGFSSGYVWNGQEPGFVGLGWLLVALAPTVELAVRAIALVLFGLLAWFVLHSDRNERFLLIAYILPAFAYQYSMNGLRIGLASGFLLIATQTLRKRGNMPALGVGLLSLLFHYSSALSLLLIAVSQRSWLRFSSVLGTFTLIISVGVIFTLVDEYFLNKLYAYQQMEAPGALSGLSKIIPLMLMLSGLVIGNLPRAKKVKLLALSTVAILAAWLLTQYSYSGLRVLDLLSFAIPLSILATYSRGQMSFDWPFKVGMIGAGLTSAAGIWRGFILSYGDGASPFLPYDFLSFGSF